jgi:uncharacterized protein (TIRG00374 family)
MGLIVILEEVHDDAAVPQSSRKRLIAIQLVITMALLAVGIWYIATQVSLHAVGSALANAHVGYVTLAILVMLVTIAFKVWRWHFLFAPPYPSLDRSGSAKSIATRPIPGFWSLFWATSLGQYVNLLVPFLRLGDLARIYALRQQAGVSGMQTLGTLVAEKALDLIFFALTIILLLPFVVLPDFYRPGLLFAVVPTLLLATLFMLAYRPHTFVQLARRWIGRLPAHWEERLSRSLIAGLEGLAALRSRRTTIVLLIMSLIIAILSVALPYFLFLAFSIPFGLVEAALMHVVVSVASAPPSTPAKIGVFNGVAALLLLQLGLQDEAVVVSYAIVFHLVVIVPQIVLGIIAAWQTDWHWGRYLRK